MEALPGAAGGRSVSRKVDDSRMSSNNSLSDGLSESLFSMVLGTAFFRVFRF